jgi:DNA-binding SARP family transcriptional activator
MRYGLLGPLEVDDGERSVKITSAKQRALLAVLLLNANQVVSSDRLIEAVWEGAPPETAAKSLQVLVSQLRKLVGKERLETRAPGYVIRVGEGELDLDRFDAHLRRARQASPPEAATALRDALALWRGPSLADFAFNSFAQVEIARLEELRLEATEERIEADLAIGRHRSVVGELDALVAEFPLRERLRGLFMLGLYRSGRQAEALQAYQDARHALVEQLGIEPGRSLRDLEQAILRQDPALDVVAQPRPAEPAESDAPERASPAPERKLATVLFADLAGCGELVGRDPERAGAELERLHDAIVDETTRAGGTVEGFVGNVAMSVFGLPAAQEDHAERALYAALAMQERFEELLGGRRGLGIGIDTGEVLTTEVRESSSFSAGESVSAAARLAEAAGRGEILVGERTVGVVRGAFAFGETRPVDESEDGIPIACRALQHSLAAPRTRGVAGMGRPFVGRQQELEFLRSAYARVVHRGEPHLVTIVGDAGVGKTSLIRQLSEWLARQTPEPILRAGRCLPYGRGITYWPLGEVLKEHLGLIESDPPATVRERLGERAILGLTLGLDVATGLHPLSARERLHAAWIELLDELVAARPTVIVVEDLHWADEPLLELLDRVLRDVSGPLLLVATARPERHDGRPPWGVGHRHASQIWLEPLSATEATRMLERMLGSGLPTRLRQLVLEPAEGNPFFVEELVAALIDRRYLVREDGIWVLRGLPTRPSVPDSIESLLAARMDLLGPSEKAALQAASVIGRVFWADPVREIVGGVDADLGVLVERDLIRRRPHSSMAGEREFTFKHALIRDVAYASLPKASRAHLHAAFAAWIERVGGGRDEHAPLLAHHYAEAVRPEDVDLVWPDGGQELEALRAKARIWLRRAAELAGGRYALDDKITLLRGAVGLEPNPVAQARLWREIAHASAVNYDDDAFKHAIAKAIEATSDDEELTELYAEFVFQCALRWQQEVDRPRIDDWSRVVLDRGGSERPRAQALIARAICHPEEAEAAAREAEAIAARLDDTELHSYALYVRADVALAAAAYDEAQRMVEARFEVLDRVVDPDHRADACWAALPAYLGNGRFADARRIALLHDEITERLTPHHRLHGVAVLLEVEQLAGNWERIRELTPRAEQAAEQNMTRCLHNRLALLTCALACAHLGDEDEAHRLEARSEESGVDLYGRAESLIWLSLHREDLTAVERGLGELERPRKSFLRSRKLAPVAARLDALAALDRRDTLERDAPPLLRPGTYLEPFALRALGVVRKDENLAVQAVERFAAMGLEWYAAQTRAQLTATDLAGR